VRLSLNESRVDLLNATSLDPSRFVATWDIFCARGNGLWSFAYPTQTKSRLELGTLHLWLGQSSNAAFV
jgi:hypothetical protein